MFHLNGSVNFLLVMGTYCRLSQDPYLPSLRREPIRKLAEPKTEQRLLSILRNHIKNLRCRSSSPFVPLFPLIRVLLQFEVGALYLLRNLFHGPSGGVERSISRVVVRQLLTQILHVSNPLLAQSHRPALPEESLEMRRKEMLKREGLPKRT